MSIQIKKNLNKSSLLNSLKHLESQYFADMRYMAVVLAMNMRLRADVTLKQLRDYLEENTSPKALESNVSVHVYDTLEVSFTMAVKKIQEEGKTTIQWSYNDPSEELLLVDCLANTSSEGRIIFGYKTNKFTDLLNFLEKFTITKDSECFKRIIELESHRNNCLGLRSKEFIPPNDAEWDIDDIGWGPLMDTRSPLEDSESEHDEAKDQWDRLIIRRELYNCSLNRLAFLLDTIRKEVFLVQHDDDSLYNIKKDSLHLNHKPISYMERMKNIDDYFDKVSGEEVRVKLEEIEKNMAGLKSSPLNYY